MSDNAIELRGLRMAYGEHLALRGIDLQVPRGTVLGYLGPNGAGKTTTVRILIGALGGFEGTAKIAGIDVAASPLEVKKRLGYVPETPALYDVLTPLEHLAFVGRLRGLKEAVITARSRAMLDALGLAEEMEAPMTTFSKGMKQKVLLVAGLLHDPEILVLDEPLSGLDAASVVVVKEIVARLAREGRTVFYCSHVMDVVERVCDHIVILKEGAIIAQGTMEALRASSGAPTLEKLMTELTARGEPDARAEAFVASLGGRAP